MTNPLRAVVFSAGVQDSAPAMAGLVAGGHQIVGVVFPTTSQRRIPRSVRYDFPGSIWSIGGILKRNAPDADVHFTRYGGDDRSVDALLERLRPDLIISSHWMRQIPDHHLAAARLGGVNLHPALLPQYRGPDPLNGMIAAGDIGTAGGVTLHQMVAGLDEGPIIAQIPLPEHHWSDLAAMRRAMGSAMYQLMRDDLNRWLSGTITARPQTGGHWHDRSKRLRQIEADWPAARLLTISRLLLQASWRRMLLNTSVGLLPLPQVLRVIGSPTGAPPDVGRNRLTFDCQDARIEATGRRRIAIALDKQRQKRALRRSKLVQGLESRAGDGSYGG